MEESPREEILPVVLGPGLFVLQARRCGLTAGQKALGAADKDPPVFSGDGLRTVLERARRYDPFDGLVMGRGMLSELDRILKAEAVRLGYSEPPQAAAVPLGTGAPLLSTHWKRKILTPRLGQAGREPAPVFPAAPGVSDAHREFLLSGPVAGRGLRRSGPELPGSPSHPGPGHLPAR